MTEQLDAGRLASIFATLRPAMTNLDKTVVMFLDNVDEAFQAASLPKGNGQHATTDGIADRTGELGDSERLGPEFSLSAQVGLLAAIRSLRSCKFLSVYASMRIEALDRRATHAMWQQERALCVQLTCTKEFAREIFEANIDATRDEQCARPDRRDDRYVRFVGFDTMPFLAEHGAPEPLFDFFHRHTLGRPRDLMALGAELARLPVDERTPEKVRHTTLRCAGNCLKAYEGAMLPAPDNRWDSALGEFDSNVLSEGDVVAISKRIVERHRIEEPITYLVDRGLLGILKGSDGQGRRSIDFREPFRYIRKGNTNLKHSPWYFLHPVLLGAVRKANQSLRVDRNTIVGNGCVFDRPVDEPLVRIDGLEDSGLTVLIDSRTVLALRDEHSVAPPVFAAIVTAAWRLGRPEIDFESFARELKCILVARVCAVQIHGLPLADVVDEWQRDEALRVDIDEVVMDLNWIIGKHLRDKSSRAYLRWDGRMFVHDLPGRIDCSPLAAELDRLCGGGEHPGSARID